MHRYTLRSPLLLAVALATTAGAQTQTPPLAYPSAARGTQVDVYHGVSIADPYRWLEDTDAPATKAWVEAENKLSDSFLASIPERPAIKDRLTQLWNYARYSAPFKEGGRYFYFENTGLQNQNVLYVQDGRNARARVLLDPNVLSPDGTVALSGQAPSDDGRYLAYSLSTSGSDWQELHVRDVDNARDLPDTLKWVKFSGISWTHDNKGFFYSRYDEPTSGNKMTNVNRNQKVYYHRIGRQQSRDELVYDRPDQPDWIFDATVSDDGQYLIITVSQGTDVRTRLYFIDLDNPGKPQINNPVVRLIDRLDAEYAFVGNKGTIFYVRTDRNAPRGRIVAISIDNPREERWNTIVAESKDALVSATMAGDDMVGNYLQDAHSTIRFFTGSRDARRDARPRQPQQQQRNPGGVYDDTSTAPISGRAQVGGSFVMRGELPLPGIGTVGELNGKQGDDELFYSFTSFLYPTTIYRFDLRLPPERAVPRAKGCVRPQQVRDAPGLLHEQGRNAGADVHHREERTRAGRLQSHAALRVRRIQHLPDADLLVGECRVARHGRHLRSTKPSGRGRVRKGVARGRHAGQKAERLRRFHRRRGVSDQSEIHFDSKAGDSRWLERWTAGGSSDDAAARSVRRRPSRGRGDGHAPLPEVHDRLGVDVRLRLVGQRRPIRVPAGLFTAPEHQAGNLLSADAGVHRRPRRPGSAGSHLQIHRDASGSSGVRESSSGSDRNEGRARRWQANYEADR